ncbi:DUF4876 domain-containing protein [Sphingobacterium alkalisoli]|uniref:DUF4876 domain-containing protein n=2 Tax=Sphingobacterium alkalisoli TaxID=1874115 RepID=A0A4U0H2E0_9SPHI|nr:DUF4876 domain-containing protein [Sphingobacterium alkalisoli]GGH18388.1 DUF4876 domain-containing protein [Sphingobacterium alkalisoli]
MNNYINMKYIKAVLLICSISLLASCRKDFTEIESVAVVFQLRFPDNFSEGSIPHDIGIQIRNNITGELKTVSSDQEGKIALDLIPGTYSFTASHTYTAEESDNLIGHAEESFVNASLTPIVITEATQIEVKLNGSRAGGLVIREFYYSGVPTSYFYDCFVEIYNNSNETIYMDSLYMGNTKSASSAAYGFINEVDSVYLAQVWMIPGSGQERSLAPGQSLIIAMDGINHKTDPNGNPNSPVNLGPGIADFETYWPYTNRDTDAPDVPNLIHAYASTTAGFDWLPGVGGTGLVLFKLNGFDDLPVSKEPGTSSTTQYKAVPTSAVIDALDAVSNSNITADKKRLPVTVDAGMTTVGASYSGKSVRRKIKNVINGQTIFQDTNNSSADFEINDTPSPRKWN